jgi:hypothetical protein
LQDDVAVGAPQAREHAEWRDLRGNHLTILERTMKRFAVAVTALALLSSAAQAQKGARLVPQTEGFTLGAATVLALGITIQGPGVDAITTNTGEGVGVQVGYGFSPNLMAFVSGTVVKQGTEYGQGGSFGLAVLEAGARMTFAQPGKRAVPYVSAHVGTHGLGADISEQGINAQVRFSGTQFGAGGGILYAFSPSLALDAGLVGDRGKFGNFKFSGDINRTGTIPVGSSTTFRLKAGFSWHP